MCSGRHAYTHWYVQFVWSKRHHFGWSWGCSLCFLCFLVVTYHPTLTGDFMLNPTFRVHLSHFPLFPLVFCAFLSLPPLTLSLLWLCPSLDLVSPWTWSFPCSCFLPLGFVSCLPFLPPLPLNSTGTVDSLVIWTLYYVVRISTCPSFADRSWTLKNIVRRSRSFLTAVTHLFKETDIWNVAANKSWQCLQNLTVTL